MPTITQVITAIPPSDPRTQTRDAFSAAAPLTINGIVDAVTEYNTFATQANALAAGLNAIATGAALAIPLTFSTTTTDSDPGNGILRLDNATQNAATTIRTDLIGNDGSTWTDVIALFDDSTSTVKGFITLVDTDDATKWLVFSVASLATPAGYVNITVANVASSAASPFANGASLALQFTRNGDKGDQGAPGTGITEQAVGFTATGGTTPKTLTVDADVTASNLAQVAVSQVEAEGGTEAALRTWSPLRVAQAIAALGGGFALGTPVASTSGTSIDFTGIPAGTKQIVISFVGVSTNGTSQPIIQIGDAGGIEATGYVGGGYDTAVPAFTSHTTGFGIRSVDATDTYSGSITLTLENSATFTWAASGSCASTARAFVTAGHKSLSAELTQLRITTVAGTSTFDAGEINIAYL